MVEKPKITSSIHETLGGSPLEVGRLDNWHRSVESNRWNLIGGFEEEREGIGDELVPEEALCLQGYEYLNLPQLIIVA